MLMDKTTEMVAHLIGIFHTSVEEVRLRDVYDKFKALKAEALENEKIDAINVSFKAGHRLEGFAPNIDYAPPDLEDDTSGPINPLFTNSGGYIPGISVALAEQSAPQQFFPFLWGGSSSQRVLEPPGSVVVITFQSSFLEDNDFVMLGDGDAIFIDPSEFLEALQQYQTVAAAIAAPVNADVLLPGETAGEDAIALQATVSSIQASSITGVSATVLHGEDAEGLHLNGLTVEENTALKDVMPEYHADKAGEETGEGTNGEGETSAGAEGETGDDDYVWPDPFEGLGNDDDDSDDFHIGAGHTVVTGGNTMVNEVSIHSAWLDAPMISVMGDVVNLDVIAQVNVLVNHDTGSIGSLSASAVLNGAGMSFTSSTPMVDETDETTPDPVAVEDTGLPSNWVVTRIEGDLISFNHVNQFSFQTDYDRAEISFSSTNTYIGMGDNTLVNLTDLSELGFGYDLIFVGGSMISVNWISQMNVLIDNDSVTYSGTTPTSVGSGDNLLFNSAEINGIGLNTHEEMSTNLAGVSNGLGGGDVGFNSAVASNPVFEGVDVLRVLYIEGDLATINWIEQTNILGDSDQVHLAMDNLEAQTGAEINVTAGSNAMANLATINEYGIDSTVAVGGGVYDDALLYQAELIDTDADPLGVDLSALTSEAVAFLADDMLSPDIGPSDDAIMATTPESTSTPDVMQTMLA